MMSIPIFFKAASPKQIKIFELDENFNFKIRDNYIELSYIFPDGNLSQTFFFNMCNVVLDVYSDYVSVALPDLDSWCRVYEYTQFILAAVEDKDWENLIFVPADQEDEAVNYDYDCYGSKYISTDK